jgi:hypothetical protein
MAGVINGQATAIANRLSSEDNTKFPIALIIPIASLLLQFLGDCWKNAPPAGVPGSINPSDYIRDHYDPATDTFEDVIVGQVRGQTRRSIRINARTNGSPRLNTFTQDEINQLSVEALKQVMNTPQVSASCLAEIDNH